MIAAEECTPSLSQAMRMKQAAQEGKLDRNGMELVMREEKPQQNNITIKGKKLDKYFPKDFTPAQKSDRYRTYQRLLSEIRGENRTSPCSGQPKRLSASCDAVLQGKELNRQPLF